VRYVRSTTPVRHARGFTLVELLVVIAIIGVLVSLLLPAVQQARESARRISCTNNVKQLTLGTLQFEEVHGTLPRSGIVDRAFREFQPSEGLTVPYEVYDQRSGKMFSWIVQILPHIEQQNLFDQFDLRRSVLDQPKEPQATFIDSLLCPSDSAEGRYYRDPEYTAGKRLAKGNYAAYVSPMHGDLQVLYPGAIISTGQRLKRVTDGVSKTIALSEVRTVDYEWDERGTWAIGWNAATQLSLDMHTYTTDPEQRHSVLDRHTAFRLYSFQSQVPNFQGGQGDILVNCPDAYSGRRDELADLQLQNMPCTKHRWELGVTGYVSSAPRSLHPGGVNVSYLDGRVEFVTDDVNPVLFSYEVGIHDGEIPQGQETDFSSR